MPNFKLANTADTFMIIGILVVAFIVVYSSGIIKKNCEDDVTCFKEALNECKTAKLISQKNNNVYSYVIEPSFRDECRVLIRLERAAPGSAPEFKRLVEHKEMECRIPKDKITSEFLDDFSTVIDNCSGDLKEGLYELIIERMYTLVVKELTGVVESAKASVYKQF